MHTCMLLYIMVQICMSFKYKPANEGTCKRYHLKVKFTMRSLLCPYCSVKYSVQYTVINLHSIDLPQLVTRDKNYLNIAIPTTSTPLCELNAL